MDKIALFTGPRPGLGAATAAAAAAHSTTLSLPGESGGH